MSDILKQDDLPDEIKNQLVSRRGIHADGLPAKCMAVAKEIARPFSINEMLIGLWNKYQLQADRKRVSSMIATHKAFQRTTEKRSEPSLYALAEGFTDEAEAAAAAPAPETPPTDVKDDKGKGKGKTGTGSGSRRSSGGRRRSGGRASPGKTS